MSGRRGFLALIGGAGAVTGSVLFRKAAAVPTLILPPEFTSSSTSAAPLAPSPAEMDAVHAVKAGLSHPMFLDWLEGGLRFVEDTKPGGGVFGAYWREQSREKFRHRLAAASAKGAGPNTSRHT